ncbi:MAG: phosphate acyltransferase [Phocaeicola sp.]
MNIHQLLTPHLWHSPTKVIKHAQADKQHIILPEGTKERRPKASNQILTDKAADLILTGNPTPIITLTKKRGLAISAKPPFLIEINWHKLPSARLKHPKQ